MRAFTVLTQRAPLVLRAGRQYCSSGGHTGTFQTPIVRALWQQRLQEKHDNESRDSEKLPGDRAVKAPQDSKVEVMMPFSSDEHLRMSYESPWGFLRTGRIIEDLDALAGNVAFRHCRVPGNAAPNLVTASVDRIHQMHRANLKVRRR